MISPQHRIEPHSFRSCNFHLLCELSIICQYARLHPLILVMSMMFDLLDNSSVAEGQIGKPEAVF